MSPFEREALEAEVLELEDESVDSEVVVEELFGAVPVIEFLQ